MSVLVLAGTKGAPGVTTAALALGAVWPRRVLLAECDPAGGDLTARFRLAPVPGLVTLASAARRSLDPSEVWAHTQRLLGGLEVLAGLGSPEQAAALGRFWAQLPAAFAHLDADVLVDGGRLVPGSPVEPLLRAAALVVLLARPTVEGAFHLANRLAALERSGVQAGVVLVGSRPFAPGIVQDALAREGLGAAVLGVLAEDRRAAALLAGQPGRERGLARSLLVRSARELAGLLAARLSQEVPA